MMFPGLTDPDQVFLNIMADQFPPVVRGAAVAAVLAAVMSTTDALLLACSSAIAHDILGGVVGRMSRRGQSMVRIGSAWGIGITAMFLALSPPDLITEFYTAGVGLLSASLFVPTVFGLWWSKANLTGGIAALVVGAAVYVVVLFGIVPIGYAPIVVALPASVMAMLVGGILGAAETEAMLNRVGVLHG